MDWQIEKIMYILTDKHGHFKSRLRHIKLIKSGTLERLICKTFIQTTRYGTTTERAFKVYLQLSINKIYTNICWGTFYHIRK